ncbi:hypothetical protein H0H81_005578 [Sphagnurus paluster]|uniref:Uncharacterized protein n=1 Tax=Sphagnurus paluster TaxID=117069 RepID=A0A9P7K173_9AGAR|nr:hypothetical protein H0H81_005578 [Sphagnurus paluster]
MLALSTLKKDGSFRQAKEVTNPIAKLEYCMRMIFMVESIRRSETRDLISAGQELERLSPWYTEKVDSTFNSLRSLQHRATSIALSTMGPPHIWWEDRLAFRTMLYQGNRIQFDDICKLFVELERLAVEAWEQDVLCGLGIRINYGNLVDDLTNRSVGYSFISETRNPFHANRDLLLEHILTSPTLRSRFISGIGPDGMPVWKKLELRAWLYKYSVFEGLLLVRAEMLGGAPGRMTELTAMTYKNVATTTHRNFMTFGKYLAMLVTYHKGTAISGGEKMIPHAFDGVTSDLLIQNLAIARPFAELAAQICHPTNSKIRQIYREHLFVNNGRLFNTDDVTQIMRQHSNPIIQYAIGVHSWRHICLAFKRKLCSSLEQLVEEEDTDTVEAQQASHSRKTENRIYGLSADSLSGVAEDVLPLYLDASTDWQIEAKTVPGGLGLTYEEARSINFDKLLHLSAFKRTSKNQQTNISNQEIVNQLATKIIPQITEQITASLLKSLAPALGTIVQDALLSVQGMIYHVFTRNVYI